MANEHVGRSRILHLVGNSHIDPVWLWQWPEGFQEIRATFRSALDRMTEDPDFIFTCDSAAYYAWIEEIEPAMFEEIRARVAEGRWELVGGWWVEPDCNIPSGESFVRQALISQLFFLDRFGKTATVGYNVDPFGHNAMLPQLLRGAGMDSYVFMRPGPHEAPLPGPLFRWESPDGSTVLAYRLPHEYCAPSEDLGYHLDKSIAQLPPGWSQMMAFYGVGNHGGGPTRANLESIRRLDGAGSMPRLIHSTPRRFFDSVDEEANIPVVVGDLQHHAIGCYSAHSGIKSWMRRAENGLVSAEAWAAVGRIAAGRPYPRDELDRAWQGVLFNQFHDTLGGTAIEPAYDDAHDQLGEASAIAARVQNIAIQSLSQLIDIGDEPGVVPIVVFNPLAWPVQAEVELEYGGLKPAAALVDELGKDVTFQSVQSYATVSSWRSRLAFETQLPALGYRTLFMRPDHPRPTLSGLSVSGTTIETPQLRVGVDPTSGRIDQLVLREHGQDVVDLADPSRGRAVVMADTSDTWGHRRTAYRDEIGVFETTSVECIEAGPVRAIVRIESRYGSSLLTEDVVVWATSGEVELRVILDWHEREALLKMRIPTPLVATTAAYEIPYGAIERPPDGDEEPGQRWIDTSGTVPGVDGRFGVALLNDGKYAFDIHEGQLGVTAVRSPIYAHHEPGVPRQGVRYAFQDQGVQRFRLRIVPHRGGWADARLTRRAMELNQRPTSLVESRHAGPLPSTLSFLSIEPENVVIGAVKLAEDSDDLVIRVVETAGRPSTAQIGLPTLDSTFAFEIGPFQIRTFRVPPDARVEPIETDLIERPIQSEPGPGASDQPALVPSSSGRSRATSQA
ncbi:MAG: alpha-mannosidase [Chloroflexota bacterium]